MIRFFVLFVLVCWGNVLFSQNPVTGGCGYTGKAPWLDWYQKHKDQFPYLAENNDWLYVPMTIFIVGNDDGVGYFPESRLFPLLCNLNAQFAPYQIRFYLHPVEPILYLNNSEWFEHDYTAGADMIQANKKSKRLNAFIVADPAGNCGYAWYDAVVLGKNCSDVNNTTWAHEIGHHFSLPHTFVGWEGTEWNYAEPAPGDLSGQEVELADHSNCQWAADGFCDTDADYLNFRWSCQNDGRSQILQTDPSGATFRSDGSLFMSYALDACANRFSDEQAQAIRADLLTNHEQYLVTDAPGPEVEDNALVDLVSPVDTQLVPFDHVTYSWSPVPDAKFYLVEVSFHSQFAVFIQSAMVVNGTSVTLTKPLIKDRLHYWRVKAYNSWDFCQPADILQKGVFKTTGSAVGVESLLEREMEMSITPNPAKAGNVIKVVVQAQVGQQDLWLSISDFSGRVLSKQKVHISENENTLWLDGQSLEPGMYKVIFENSKGRIAATLGIVE